MFFELPWVGVAMDAMAIAIHIKYVLSLNRLITTTRHPFATTYIFFSKNHQALISLCVTSSLESTSCLIPSALHKTPC